MANYFVSYDLNGDTPSHAQMDKHMEGAGWARGRVLETGWYVGASVSLKAVYDHVNSILSANDRLLVIAASNAHFWNLLVSDASLQDSWSENS